MFDAQKVEQYLNEIFMPFASNPVWDEVHEHLSKGNSLECMRDKDGYEVGCGSVLHDAWWDYFFNLDIPAYKVLYLMRLQCQAGPNGNGFHDIYEVEDAHIDEEKDSWEEALSKLDKYTYWCGDGYWFIWLVHSECDFQYSPLQTGKDVCEQYIKFLLDTQVKGHGLWYETKDLSHMKTLVQLLNEKMDSFKSALGRARGQNIQESQEWFKDCIEGTLKRYKAERYKVWKC